MEETNISTNDIEKLFNAGVHLGHKKNRLHPKARKYVYKIVNGTAIIDLTKTVVSLNNAKAFLSQNSKDGKVMLVVATKRVANQFAADLCKEYAIPYITAKWLPGLLTNFETIMKNVKKMKQLETDRESGAWDKFVKHERTKLGKELNKLKKLYEGLATLEKRPDVLFIVDVKKEKNALTEARQNSIPVVAVIDTNANPAMVTYPIIGNDDSATSVQLLVRDIIESFAKAK